MEVTMRFETSDEEKVTEALGAAHAIAPLAQLRMSGTPCDVATLPVPAKPEKKAAKKKAAK